MRKTSLIIACLLSFLIVAGGIILFSPLLMRNQVQAVTVKRTSQVSQTYSREPGIPAITPHLSTAHGGAAFTEQDVRQYISSHPLPPGLSLPAGTKLVIVKIAFLQSQQVSGLTEGESTGMPATHLLCYVELHGVANFSGPGGTTGTLQKIEMVFDAQTGNLLMDGGI